MKSENTSNFMTVVPIESLRRAVEWLAFPTLDPPPEAKKIGQAIQAVISRRWHTGVVPPKPAFLISEKATRAFVDSVRHALQNDPNINGWPDTAYFNLASSANALLLQERELDFSEEIVGRNIDIINQELFSASSAVGPGVYGDPGDETDEAGAAAFLAAASHPEIQLAATLISMLPDSVESKLLQIFGAVTISWDENQWDGNATIGTSSARGFWATTDAAIITGLAYFKQRWPSVSLEAVKAWIADNIPDANLGSDPIIGGIGVLTKHHDRIMREWNWSEESGWTPVDSANPLYHRYTYLLRYRWSGYFMLAISHHVGDKARISPYESHHIKTGLPMAIAVDAQPNVVSQLAASIKMGDIVVQLNKPLEGVLALNQRIASAAGVRPSRLVRGDAPAAAITSGWQKNRTLYRYMNGKWQWVTRDHKGLDLRARTPQPVFSPWDGKVLRSYYSSSYGHTLWIDFPSKGYSMLFAHLSRRLANPGDNVKEGQLIAMTGATPKNTPPHLHLEQWLHGDGKPLWHINEINPVSSSDGAWKKVLASS